DLENTTVLIAPSVTDPDSTAFTYAASGLPSGIAIDAGRGKMTGTLDFASAGKHVVRVTVRDNGGLANSTSFVWIVTNVNRPPALAQPLARTDAEGASVSIALAATDPD